LCIHGNAELAKGSVNIRVAGAIGGLPVRMVAGNLKEFATYFDLESGTARSLYITQQSVWAVAKATAS
jgi:hypothetical protein